MGNPLLPAHLNGHQQPEAQASEPRPEAMEPDELDLSQMGDSEPEAPPSWTPPTDPAHLDALMNQAFMDMQNLELLQARVSSYHSNPAFMSEFRGWVRTRRLQMDQMLARFGIFDG